MYSVVLMMAVTSGADTVACHRHRCCAPSCVIVPCCEAPAPVDQLSAEEREAFETAIEEVKSFGDDDTAKALVKEIQDTLNSGDYAKQKEWLDYYTPEISKEEQAAFDKYVAALPKAEDRKAEKEAWEGTSNAGKRYYLAFLDIAPQEQEVAAPARLIVNIPADARLIVNGAVTPLRWIRTRNLDPNYEYHYDVRVEMRGADGEAIVQSQRVEVLPGQQTTVTFDPATGNIASNR